MTNEENIKAILESNFAGFKGEIIERATKSILELEPKKSDDAIHRGDVLTAINDFCQCVEEYGAYNKLYDFVENLPSVSTEKTGRWIPVSEKLPEENEYIEDVCKYYLIQDEYGDMHVAHLSNVGWIPMDSLKAIGNEVIAWMPLPEPYKRESEDKE